MRGVTAIEGEWLTDILPDIFAQKQFIYYIEISYYL